MTTTDDADRDALLPCPFCGSVSGPKLWDSVSNDFATGESHWVYCGGCAVVSPHWGTKARAVESWNRRSTGAGEAAMRDLIGMWRDRAESMLRRAKRHEAPEDAIKAQAWNSAANELEHRLEVVHCFALASAQPSGETKP